MLRYVKIFEDRKEYYNKDNQLHREDGPAIEYNNGDESWYLNGESHREDGPARINLNGSEEWWFNGELHRENGPARISGCGTKSWYKFGKRHREDGPAVEYVDGSKKWYIEGNRMTEEEFLKATSSTTTCESEIDDGLNGEQLEILSKFTAQQILQYLLDSTE